MRQWHAWASTWTLHVFLFSGSVSYWVGLWDTEIFSLVGFIRTLCSNIFRRVAKANQAHIRKEMPRNIGSPESTQ